MAANLAMKLMNTDTMSDVNGRLINVSRARDAETLRAFVSMCCASAYGYLCMRAFYTRTRNWNHRCGGRICHTFDYVHYETSDLAAGVIVVQLKWHACVCGLVRIERNNVITYILHTNCCAQLC